MKKRIVWQNLFILLSFIIVAFGQPSWVAFLAFPAGSFAYALFWGALKSSQRALKKNFLLSVLWFTGVQLVQLSWMMATDYQGSYIFLFLFVISLAIGLQFGLLSSFLLSRKALTVQHAFFAAALYTLFEWSRLFILTGFPWSSVALSLSSNNYSLQIAAIAGLYGMTFWVIFCNALALRAWAVSFKRNRWKSWVLASLFPYLFGFAHQSYHEMKMSKDKEVFPVTLVHTAVTPEERNPLLSDQNQYVQSYRNWCRVLRILREIDSRQSKVIVFPESIVSLGASFPFYPLEVVEATFRDVLGERPNFLPVKMDIHKKMRLNLVSNSYWGQAISNYFGADVVLGMDDYEEEEGGWYNAAFHFQPFKDLYNRYEKKILIPGAEYLPFSWVASIAKRYGIEGSFQKGGGMKLFFTSEEVPFSIAICSEEVYGNYIRNASLLGARLLITIHNDVWFPHSRLPQQHFFLGRIRAVENGIPLIRSTNVGITGAVDSLGRLIAFHKNIWADGILTVNLPAYTYWTLYTYCGDMLIVIFSFVFLLIGGLKKIYFFK